MSDTTGLSARDWATIADDQVTRLGSRPVDVPAHLGEVWSCLSALRYVALAVTEPELERGARFPSKPGADFEDADPLCACGHPKSVHSKDPCVRCGEVGVCLECEQRTHVGACHEFSPAVTDKTDPLADWVRALICPRCGVTHPGLPCSTDDPADATSITQIAPGCIASSAFPGRHTVINWQGVNFVPQECPACHGSGDGVDDHCDHCGRAWRPIPGKTRYPDVLADAIVGAFNGDMNDIKTCPDGDAVECASIQLDELDGEEARGDGIDWKWRSELQGQEIERLRAGVREAVDQLRAEHRDMSGVNFCVTCDIGMPCPSAQVADRLETLIGAE